MIFITACVALLSMHFVFDALADMPITHYSNPESERTYRERIHELTSYELINIPTRDGDFYVYKTTLR